MTARFCTIMCTVMNVYLLPERRREIILERLNKSQRVVARELADEFGVSEDAIRRDLRDLAGAGKCRRVYGGALPLTDTAPFVDRVDRNFTAKRALARAAAALVKPRDTIYIDAGTTNLLLAETLPLGQPVTVITNSVTIAAALYRKPEVTLFLIGGHVDPQIDAAVGGTAVAQIGRYRPDITFTGVCAVSASWGLSVLDERDADVKRAAIEASRRLVVLATNDKLGRAAPYHIAPAAGVQALVVERTAPADEASAFEQIGSMIIRAEGASDIMAQRAD